MGEDREFNGEDGAFSLGAFRPDGAVVIRYAVFHDRQTETGAFDLA